MWREVAKRAAQRIGRGAQVLEHVGGHHRVEPLVEEWVECRGIIEVGHQHGLGERASQCGRGGVDLDTHDTLPALMHDACAQTLRAAEFEDVVAAGAEGQHQRTRVVGVVECEGDAVVGGWFVVAAVQCRHRNTVGQRQVRHGAPAGTAQKVLDSAGVGGRDDHQQPSVGSTGLREFGEQPARVGTGSPPRAHDDGGGVVAHQRVAKVHHAGIDGFDQVVCRRVLAGCDHGGDATLHHREVVGLGEVDGEQPRVSIDAAVEGVRQFARGGGIGRRMQVTETGEERGTAPLVQPSFGRSGGQTHRIVHAVLASKVRPHRQVDLCALHQQVERCGHLGGSADDPGQLAGRGAVAALHGHRSAQPARQPVPHLVAVLDQRDRTELVE